MGPSGTDERPLLRRALWPIRQRQRFRLLRHGEPGVQEGVRAGARRVLSAYQGVFQSGGPAESDRAAASAETESMWVMVRGKHQPVVGQMQVGGVLALPGM